MIRFRKAVLIIHGFAGGVYDEEYLATMLEINKKLDVYTFTLPGHSFENIKNITYKDWIEKSEKMTELLIDAGYKSIYVIGHSMGGVIATYIAGKYKEVKKLVLAAPAFQITGYEEEKWDIPKIFQGVPKIFEQYGFKFVKDRMKKIPVGFYKEFLDLIKKFEDTPQKINIPTFLIWGREDNIVPLDTSKNLLEKLATDNKKLLVVNDATHNLFNEKRKEEITEYIEKFLMKDKAMYKFPDEIGEIKRKTKENKKNKKA